MESFKIERFAIILISGLLFNSLRIYLMLTTAEDTSQVKILVTLLFLLELCYLIVIQIYNFYSVEKL